MEKIHISEKEFGVLFALSIFQFWQIIRIYIYSYIRMYAMQRPRPRPRRKRFKCYTDTHDARIKPHLDRIGKSERTKLKHIELKL